MPTRPCALIVSSDAADLLHVAGSGNPGVDELIAGLAYAPPLQGLGSGDSPAFECWLADTRQALHRAWRAALLRRSQARLHQDAAAAAAGAERLLAQDPLDEDAARLLEAAWRALGRSADAERWRDTFALRLQQELGLRAAAGHLGSDGAVAPPADAPGLLGRAHDLLALRALLDDRRTRLVTVTGPGGVGKSALALALLREGGVDADSMLWVALEDLSDLAQVPLRIARELGVPASAAGDGWAEVRTALGCRQMLLVLDNAEHLPQLPAALQRLLGDVPTLRCVVTSRQRLGLAQELLLPLEPLDAQAASQLFLRGAQAAPWRRPIDAHDPLLPTLLDLLGRLPLALALAAAWTRHLQLPALVQQVGRVAGHRPGHGAGVGLQAGQVQRAQLHQQLAQVAVGCRLRPLGPEQRGQRVAWHRLGGQCQVGGQAEAALVGKRQRTWRQHRCRAQQAQPGAVLPRRVGVGQEA